MIYPPSLAIPSVDFFFNATATPAIYTLSLHDALPISIAVSFAIGGMNEVRGLAGRVLIWRSEEHTSELQSLTNLVCRLLLEKKKEREYRRLERGRRGNVS